MSKKLKYVKFLDDDGKEHLVDQAEAFESEFGFLKRPNGEVWRRAPIGNSRRSTSQVSGGAKHVSDSMGFTAEQLPEMKKHLETMGVSGIEFKPDPQEGSFYQVHASSAKAMDRYRRARQFEDRNSRNGSGATINPKMLEDAKHLILRSCKQ